MKYTSDEVQKALESINEKIDRIEGYLKTPGGPVIHHVNKTRNDLLNAIYRHDFNNYSQIESFLKLFEINDQKHIYPPMRGWAISPDLALLLHNSVVNEKPTNILEFGCGVSTIVFANALRKNGKGKLFSIESSSEFAAETQRKIDEELLTNWVEITVAELVDVSSSIDGDKPIWYDISTLKKQRLLSRQYDILLVDGPPGKISKMSRFPALPIFFKTLSDKAIVYLDDARREDEYEIAKKWAHLYDMEHIFLPFEKGLSIFKNRVV
ncbi:class I SAM-dependent methyltransferase [Halomonas sp.]|uniref:class I SAM-dependent methyltransferase n=1 Tax=Halomonas sp. TaxID=1486246 RepID=UPI003A8F3915